MCFTDSVICTTSVSQSSLINCSHKALHVSHFRSFSLVRVFTVPVTHHLVHLKIASASVNNQNGCLCFMPVPEVVGGRQLTAVVIDLNPWVEYEFRVLASNRIGTGEPSKPSKQARTKSTCTYMICFPRVQNSTNWFNSIIQII